jgi:hypothetical protein
MESVDSSESSFDDQERDIIESMENDVTDEDKMLSDQSLIEYYSKYNNQININDIQRQS